MPRRTSLDILGNGRERNLWMRYVIDYLVSGQVINPISGKSSHIDQSVLSLMNNLLRKISCVPCDEFDSQALLERQSYPLAARTSEPLTVHTRNLALPATQMATHVLVLARANFKHRTTASEVVDAAALFPA